MPSSIDLGLSWKPILEAFFLVFKYTWWIFPLALFQPFLEWIFAQLERERDLKLGLTAIDRMDGVRFEEWLANFFRARGYRVQTTPRTGDYGVDLVLERNGQKIVVQAKRWKGKVGPKAIQEIYAGKTYYGADVAMAVTNSYFTYEAKRLAKKTGVVLWDRNTLRAELQNDKKRSETGSPQSHPGQKQGSPYVSRTGSLHDKRPDSNTQGLKSYGEARYGRLRRPSDSASWNQRISRTLPRTPDV